MQLEYIQQILVQIKFVFLVDQMQLQYHCEYITLKCGNLRIMLPNLNVPYRWGNQLLLRQQLCGTERIKA